MGILLLILSVFLFWTAGSLAALAKTPNNLKMNPEWVDSLLGDLAMILGIWVLPVVSLVFALPLAWYWCIPINLVAYLLLRYVVIRAYLERFASEKGVGYSVGPAIVIGFIAMGVGIAIV